MLGSVAVQMRLHDEQGRSSTQHARGVKKQRSHCKEKVEVRYATRSRNSTSFSVFMFLETESLYEALDLNPLPIYVSQAL